jgi:hypothetical protein
MLRAFVSIEGEFTMPKGLKYAVAIAGVLAFAGVALAASGGSGVIHSCYSKKSGALRVLVHGRCRRSERAVA